MTRILVVDDEPDIRQAVAHILKKAGYDVAEAGDGKALYREIGSGYPDLIILDLTLGSENGLELAMEIRKNSTVPIIMLSGKSAETDRVVGLELGADDYIAKPYSSAELLARVKSVLRRSAMTEAGPPIPQRRIARFQGFECDLDARTLSGADGDKIKLTAGEFALLETFLANPGRVLSREALLDDTGSENTFDRSIDVQIMRLRRKIEESPTEPKLIQAVRAVGYIFATNVEWA